MASKTFRKVGSYGVRAIHNTPGAFAQRLSGWPPSIRDRFDCCCAESALKGDRCMYGPLELAVPMARHNEDRKFTEPRYQGRVIADELAQSVGRFGNPRLMDKLAERAV